MADVVEQVEEAAAGEQAAEHAAEPVAEQVLVEEVSIDGMCGVY